MNHRKRFNVICCGRRWGKSNLANILLAETAIEGFPAGYFTPTYKLLAGTYKELAATLEPVTVRRNENQFIEVEGGGVVDFWSMENDLAGRSRKYKISIIDEAAYVSNLWTRWTESVRPTLTDYKGDAWFLSTPKGKNDFYKLFLRGLQNEANWYSSQNSTYTNPYIDPGELDDARKDLPILAFSQEYLAEFNENISNPFGLQFIRQCTYPLSSLPPVCFGIDLAKSSDYTAIIGLDLHGQVCYFDRFQKDWRGTIKEIIALPAVPTKIDSTGVGDPIVEELQGIRPSIIGFKFNRTSKQQIMEGLAVAIQARKIAFPEGNITIELENFEYQFSKEGVKYSAPNGLHDDCVCALALAWSQYLLSGVPSTYSISFL